MTTREDEKISFTLPTRRLQAQCLHEELSRAKAKALGERYANTYKDTVVIFKRLSILSSICKIEL